LVDRWGIPHIRAQSLLDLFFVQGFNAARTAFGSSTCGASAGSVSWQPISALAIWPRIGPHACSSIVATWRQSGSATRRMLRQSAPPLRQGINAFIDLAEREPQRMPPEFSMLGHVSGPLVA
jgi:penicillin amidase